MSSVIYRVRLRIKPEQEEAFNQWYEGTYIPRLMREVPHFSAVRRYVSNEDDRIYITDYQTTAEDLPLAFSEMRSPEREDANAEFYRWRDSAITLHESFSLHERLFLPGIREAEADGSPAA